MGINNTIGQKMWQPNQPEKAENSVPEYLQPVQTSKAPLVFDELEEIEDFGT